MFAIHDKSLVRTAARRTLRTILNDPVMITSNGYHRGASGVGEVLIKQLQQSACKWFARDLKTLKTSRCYNFH